MSSHQKTINQYSLRAKNLLDHPQFAMNPDIQTGSSWKIEYSGETPQFQTDKILTLQYSNRTADDIRNIFFESFCRLSQGKTVKFLFVLTYREIESFLRDENHVPAFEESLEPRALEVFQQVKMSLLVHILSGKICLPEPWGKQKKAWNELSLVDKNRAALALIGVLGKLFFVGKQMELVLAEESTLTVKKNDFPLDLEIIGGLMGHLFSFSSIDSPLKVVGTL